MHAYYRWKYTVLLLVLISLLFARVTTFRDAFDGTLIEICGALLLVFALLTICDHRRFRAAACALCVPAILSTIASQFTGEPMAHQMLLLGRAFTTGFLGFTIVMILRELLTQRVVTWDSVIGTFCGYVLIGVMWSEMYSLVLLLSPEALHFTFDTKALTETDSQTFHYIQYFSFVTLSTVGYGDVTPVSPMARALAMLEAVCGQFYLAVLVAALVGMRVSSRMAGEQAREAER